MKCNCKFKATIYKGMIDYLLSSTHFSLKDIANHTGSPISSLRSIYYDQTIPSLFSSEIALTRLYLIILDIQMNRNKLHSDE